MPPPSSGGVALIEMLNVLEGYDLAAMGFGSAHADAPDGRSRCGARTPTARSYLGDPDFNTDMPIARLISKEYAADLRKTINPKQGVEVVADDVRVAARKRRDDAHLGRRRRAATPCR